MSVERPGDAGMPHYHIQRKDDPVADSYWVFAASPGEARRLIALNVVVAAEAEDETKFLCDVSSRRRRPRF
jgi:hypothetical protein